MHSTGGASNESDKASATLHGLALGDALGMPSQSLTVDQIQHNYGTITDFVAPCPDHPVSAGLSAAQVTDDTEQALLLARRLIDAPEQFDAAGWARDLLNWEENIQSRGLLDLLGPSSKAALEAIRQGTDPGEAGKGGTTNGAAMRIAPVGILVPADDIVSLVDAVEQACRATHNTGEAIAAAAAVAAYISSRISGVGDNEAFSVALQAARSGQQRGYPVGAGDIAALIERASELASSGMHLDAFAKAVGTSVASRESVPAAFGIMRLAKGNVWRAGLMAANIGDDTDTIGAIACAMCGAGAGLQGIPTDRLEELKAANDLQIESISTALIALRQQSSDQRQEVSL